MSQPEGRDTTSKVGTARGTRPRRVRIEVWLTPEERDEILKKAEKSGMKGSAFLRALGLNQPIRSVVDLKAVADLAKVNGDLGRVAGLLKLWLAERRGEGAHPMDVEEMMFRFRGLQHQVFELMGKITRDR